MLFKLFNHDINFRLFNLHHFILKILGFAEKFFFLWRDFFRLVFDHCCLGRIWPTLIKHWCRDLRRLKHIRYNSLWRLLIIKVFWLSIANQIFLILIYLSKIWIIIFVILRKILFIRVLFFIISDVKSKLLVFWLSHLLLALLLCRPRFVQILSITINILHNLLILPPELILGIIIALWYLTVFVLGVNVCVDAFH